MRRGVLVTTLMIAGFVFLYVPILVMIVFSFNNSTLVTDWDTSSPPTLKWYVVLFHNEQFLQAAWRSLQIAAMTATGAVVLGTLAGIALSRFGSFRGRSLLAGMSTAPLVMPEVVTGFSMLLLFLAMEEMLGWPQGRGMITIVIAHITFAMAYVTVIVQSRLASFDQSLEEAAMDLGARPAKVFGRITLPLIFPALLSGWLLAFTLSWDDVVISQFVAGPGSTTLPAMIFSKVRRGMTPDVNALATIMVLVVASGVIVAAYWMKRAEKRRHRETRMAETGTQG
jgi:putrescine transport system permease protein